MSEHSFSLRSATSRGVAAPGRPRHLSSADRSGLASRTVNAIAERERSTPTGSATRGHVARAARAREAARAHWLTAELRASPSSTDARRDELARSSIGRLETSDAPTSRRLAALPALAARATARLRRGRGRLRVRRRRRVVRRLAVRRRRRVVRRGAAARVRAGLGLRARLRTIGRFVRRARSEARQERDDERRTNKLRHGGLP